MQPTVMSRHRTLVLFIAQEPATYLMTNSFLLDIPQKETTKLLYLTPMRHLVSNLSRLAVSIVFAVTLENLIGEKNIFLVNDEFRIY